MSSTSFRLEKGFVAHPIAFGHESSFTKRLFPLLPKFSQLRQPGDIYLKPYSLLRNESEAGALLDIEKGELFPLKKLGAFNWP